MLKLIAADMDGTFLTSARQPHPDNLRAARQAIDEGVTFCIASGRAINAIRPTLALLELPGPVVASNGALVIGPQGETVQDLVLPQEAIEIIIGYAASVDVHTNAYHGETTWFTHQGEEATLYVERTRVQPVPASYQDLAKNTATKLLLIDQPEAILRHAKTLHEHLAHTGVNIVISEPDYVEFLPPHVNKGAGLQALAAHMGLQANEVAAIGDWLNDLEMLQWAGTSAAVENAAPEIKAAAQIIVPSNDNAGVADFIHALLQERRVSEKV